MKLLKIKKLFICLFAAIIFSGCGLVNSSYSSQGKPLLVEISTNWCFACKLLKPTIEGLINEYSSEVEFVLLDLSNEETTKNAQQVAQNYGISNFFNSHRNIFPTVGILRSDGAVEKVIVGANSKEAYSITLNNLLRKTEIANNESTKDNTNTEEINNITSGRPDPINPQPRPDTPNFLDRPLEIISSGRPPEITFWSIGQSIPVSAYFNYLVLPKCSANNNVLCNNIPIPSQTQTKQDGPIFKPWTPNSTRDEKGLHF